MNYSSATDDRYGNETNFTHVNLSFKKSNNGSAKRIDPPKMVGSDICIMAKQMK